MSYKDIDIPPGKDPTAYSYQERRAELFQYIIEAGHPDLLNQTEFAKRYDVDQSTVSRDIAKIRDDVKDELGTDADLIIYSVFQKGLRDLVRKEKFEEAMTFAKEWADFLFDRADSGYDRAAQKHDIDADVRQAAVAADARFEVVLGSEGENNITSIMDQYNADDEALGFAATPNAGDVSVGGGPDEMDADLIGGTDIPIDGVDETESGSAENETSGETSAGETDSGNINADDNEGATDDEGDQ